MTPTQALTAIQTMADHSQNWLDGTSNRNVSSNSNTDGLAAIVNKEFKRLEEVKYGEFGRSAPFNGSNGAKFHVGLSGYYTRTDNRPPYGEKRLSLEELMNKHQEESARKSAQMDEWIKKL
nr:DNA-binding pseudobarrel domain-containing protein [Tanacetum cinerariifolium]